VVNKNYWNIEIKGFQFGEQYYSIPMDNSKANQALIDSGTSFIYLNKGTL
jgi:hypothetical protein